MTDATATGGRPPEVDFHFDVMCPYAYAASQWIREVREATGLTVHWRFFSLEEVNRAEGKKHPWERPWSYGWSLLRVCALLRRTDEDLVDRFYEAAARGLHVEARKVHLPDGAREVAAGIGLDPSVVDEAIDDPTTTDEVRADHERVVALGGYGVPTLVFPEGDALFGPVMTPAPEGDAAVRLWDLVVGWREFPHLYELRRPKTAADWRHIGKQFEPYLAARDWQTVQNEVA
jgi:2-hydroxychromene-2-carboxylate isomerase